MFDGQLLVFMQWRMIHLRSSSILS